MIGRRRIIVWSVALALFGAAFALTLFQLSPLGLPRGAERIPRQTVIAEGAETVVHYLLEDGQIAKTEVSDASRDLIGKNFFAVKEAKPEWSILSFAPERIVASRPCPSLGGPGGFLRTADGFVAIYSGERNGCHTLIEQTDIHVAALPENVQNSLENGVPFVDHEDLPQILDGLLSAR